MTRLVIFDVDGTFLNSYGLYEKVVETYSRENNMPFPCIASIKKGYGAPEAFDFKWGVPREEQRKHLHATFKITDEWSISNEAEKTPMLFDGVVDTMTHLKDLGYTLAIVTSKPEAPLLHLLEYHKIGHFFGTQRNWDDIKRRGLGEKPSPDKLHCVMRELKISPEEAVMIGDTAMDMGAGSSAGTSTIGVTWGVHDEEILRSTGAQHIVRAQFSDLVPVIKSILK